MATALPNCDIALIDRAVTSLAAAFGDPKSFIRQIVGGDLSDDHVLCRLVPVHFALMAISGEVSYLTHLLAERGFKITQQFPSEVVTARLVKKYHRPDIAVTILKAQNRSGQELELFVVTQGLAKEEVVRELPSCTHFAFTVEREMLPRVPQVADELGKNGFVPSGGGLNEVEGVTVLYFERGRGVLGSVTVEILIPEICRDLVEWHKMP